MFDIITETDIKFTEAENKKQGSLAKKNMKKGVYSEPILGDIVKCLPPEIVMYIGEFISYETWNNLLSDNLYVKIWKTGASTIISRLLDCITTSNGFLTILTREEAFSYVTNRGYYSQTVLKSGTGCQVVYRPLYIKEVRDIIYTIIEIAKKINPKFAYKILKIISVLNAGKYKITYYYNLAGLTYSDLPEEYKI